MTTHTTLAGALRAAVEARAERDDARGERDAYMRSYEATCAERDSLTKEIARLKATPRADDVGQADDEAQVERVARALCRRRGTDPDRRENMLIPGHEPDGVFGWQIYELDARAAIAAMPPPQDGWRPIESATGLDPVLLCDANGYRWIGYMSFGEDDFEWRSNDESADQPPTAWMPLPLRRRASRHRRNVMAKPTPEMRVRAKRCFIDGGPSAQWLIEENVAFALAEAVQRERERCALIVGSSIGNPVGKIRSGYQP